MHGNGGFSRATLFIAHDDDMRHCLPPGFLPEP
jgi:hypothetical protein